MTGEQNIDDSWLRASEAQANLEFAIESQQRKGVIGRFIGTIIIARAERTLLAAQAELD